MRLSPFTCVAIKVLLGIISWGLSIAALGYLLLGGLDLFMRNKWQEIWDLWAVPLLLLTGVTILIVLVICTLGFLLKRSQVDN